MNKFALLLPLLALCYANIAGAQRFAPGYCPTVTGHENFEKSKVSRRIQTGEQTATTTIAPS